MPTSSQALNILRDVNTPDAQNLLSPRPMDGPEVDERNDIHINGTGLRYETLDFQEEEPLSFPETKLEPCEARPRVIDLSSVIESVDDQRPPPFQAPALAAPVGENFEEAGPPPSSVCASHMDLSKNFDQAPEPKPLDTVRKLCAFQPLHALQGSLMNRQAKPPHRWGARLIKPSPRSVKPRAEDYKRSNVFPDIHAKTHKVTPKTPSMRSDDQNQMINRLNYDDFNMECRRLTFEELSSKYLANKSWFENTRRRNPNNKSYWNFRAVVLEAMRKSNLNHEDYVRIVGVLGANEKQRVQKSMKRERADVGKPKKSSFHTPESGDNDAIKIVGGKDWFFPTKNNFSPFSGNPTSALRRQRTARANFPSNFMDFTLRFGSSIKLNNIFEATGRHLKEEDDEGQSLMKGVPGCQKEIPIAEGVNFQDLLPSTKKLLDRQLHTNKSEISTALTGSHASQDKNRSNGRVKGSNGIRTSLPNFMTPGIVEHGFYRPEYGHPMQSVTSRVIEVEGSEPQARRSLLFGSKCHSRGFEGNYEERIEQNCGSVGGQEPFNVQVGNGNKYSATDGGYSLIERSNGASLHQMLTGKDFSFNSDVQARVREIGLYEETRKRVLASDRNASISGDSESSTPIRVPSSAYSSTCSDGEEKCEQKTSPCPPDSSRAEFSEKLQNTAMPTENPEPTSGLSTQRDNGHKDAKDNTDTFERDIRNYLRDLNNGRIVAEAKRKERRKNGCISFKGGIILPPSKTAIPQAKTLDAYFEEQIQKTIRKFESEETGSQKSSETECEGEVEEEEELGYCYWQNEQEEQLFKRIKSKVLRMRKVLPPSSPNKLCFVSKIASCSHQEVKEGIESSGSVTVTRIQYDPVYLGEGNPDHYVGLWMFDISKDSDKTNLLLTGFKLKGRPMNVRYLDDVTMEEYRAFHLYHAIRLEQRKKKLNRRSKRR